MSLPTHRATTLPESESSTEAATGTATPRTLGAHEIVATLGAGEMTEVLLAVTRGPHGFARPVVLKCARGMRLDRLAASSIAREALAYARVAHPAIVQLYEFFEHDRALVLVLEYVPGMTLGRLLRLLQRRERLLDDVIAMYVMADVFSALAALHAARDPLTGEYLPVIHRDVTPSNVLLAWDGATKLADLGIARLAGVASDSRVGLLKGTYGYMAPEQVTGDPVTTRTDVYCACLLLRELLLGRRTFPRDRPELELLQAMATPSLVPIERLRGGVPERVREVLRIGLAPDPERRTVTAADVRNVLLEIVPMLEGREQLRALLSGVRPRKEPLTTEESVTTNPLQADTLVELAGASRPSRSELREASTSGVITADRFLPSAPPVTKSTSPLDPDSSLAPPRLDSVSPRTAVGRHVLLALVATASVVAIALGLRGRKAHVSPLAPGLARSAALGERGDPGGAGKATPTAATAPQIGPHDTPAPAQAVPSAAGDIVSEPTPYSHRIYVDGRVLGESGARIRVRCGWHSVRFGSRGQLQRVDVPCGGSVVLRPRW